MSKYQLTLPCKIFLIILSLIVVIRIFTCFCFPSSSIYHGNETSFTGTITAYKINGNLLSLTIKSEENLVVYYTIKTETEKNEWLDAIGYGKEVEVIGSLEEATSSSFPNTFDYQEYLYYKHIFYTVEASSVTITKEENILYKLKNKIVKHLQSLSNKEYYLAFILGNTSELDTSLISQNGISHLFAISGLHISLLITFIGKIFKRKKKFITYIVLLFYVFFVNFLVSVLRVVLSFFLKQLNETFNFHLNDLVILYLVFLVLLLIDPFYLKNIGFQYSFLISFCILKAQKKSTFKTTLFIFLCSIPITAMNNYEINILSVIFNILFIPFVSFILFPLCFITAICPFLTNFFSIFVNIFELLNTWCSKITWGVIIIPKTSWIMWGSYFLIFYHLLKKEKKRYYILLIIILLIIKLSPKLDTSAYVYFLDVGQGDSTLFVSPHQQEIILIDTGGKTSYYESDWQIRTSSSSPAKTMITFFHSLGITKIDYLILTHGDTDHTGNALEILNSKIVSKVILNYNEDNEIESNIRLNYNVTSTIKTSFFEFLEFTDMTATDENDASLIYQITCYNTTILMMGDAGSTVESKILKENIQSDILKVGHHGSKTSSSYTFLKKVNPLYAIISVGENNIYNHPSQTTIDNLEKLNISYYETKDEGTIIFKIKKYSFEKI